MDAKLSYRILLVLIFFFLVPRPTQASKMESASLSIANYESRLKKIEQRLEQIDSPIQQMAPESADALEDGISDIQMSFDDVSERLAIIRFVMNREGSAPQDKRDLAQAELNYLEADIEDLEDQTSNISNEVDSLVWY